MRRPIVKKIHDHSKVNSSILLKIDQGHCG